MQGSDLHDKPCTRGGFRGSGLVWSIIKDLLQPAIFSIQFTSGSADSAAGDFAGTNFAHCRTIRTGGDSVMTQVMFESILISIIIQTTSRKLRYQPGHF